jgi:hypothetical protein
MHPQALTAERQRKDGQLLEIKRIPFAEQVELW